MKPSLTLETFLLLISVTNLLQFHFSWIFGHPTVPGKEHLDYLDHLSPYKFYSLPSNITSKTNKTYQLWEIDNNYYIVLRTIIKLRVLYHRPVLYHSTYSSLPPLVSLFIDLSQMSTICCLHFGHFIIYISLPEDNFYLLTDYIITSCDIFFVLGYTINKSAFGITFTISNS